MANEPTRAKIFVSKVAYNIRIFDDSQNFQDNWEEKQDIRYMCPVVKSSLHTMWVYGE